MLLIAIEVLSRTPWKNTWAWMLVRFGGVGVVALGSAVISYGHIHEVLLSWGYDWIGAGVGPLVVDGLMTISGFALLAISQTAPATSEQRDAGTAPAVRPDPAPSQDERPKTVRRERPATKAAAERVPLPAPSRDAATAVPAPVSSREERLVPTAASRPEGRPVVPASRNDETTDADRDVPPAPEQRPAVPAAPAATQDGTSWEEMARTLKQRGDVPAEEAWQVIRAYRDATGTLPTPNLLRKHLPMGHGRATKLLAEVDSPDSGRPDLHAVHVEAS